MIDYNNRRFRMLYTSTSGTENLETIFEYYQQGNVVWGVYYGGTIQRGNFLAKVDGEGVLDLRFQHVNSAGDLLTGTCVTTPEVLEDGRLRLHEVFQWTSGDGSDGMSTVEEIKN